MQQPGPLPTFRQARVTTLRRLSAALRANPWLPDRLTLPRWAHLPDWRPRPADSETIDTTPLPAHRFPEFPRLDYTIHPGKGDSGRVLVLLRGINTSATSCADQIDHWRFIVDDISDLYSGIVYFSYSSTDPAAYTDKDTHEGVWTHHRQLLYNLLAGCYDQGYREFDLIGHSLGGVVATEYLTVYGLTGPQAGWVKHVITLDSPVNGSSRAAARNFAYQEMYQEMGIQAMLDIADMYLNREHYERVKARLLDQLREAGVVYWNLTSVDDWVVPVEDAILTNASRTYHLGRALHRLEPSLNRGHAQVFYSTLVRQDIRAILAGEAPPDQIPASARLPMVMPARHLAHAAGDTLRRATDAPLVQLAMMLTVLHYTRQDPDAAPPLTAAREALTNRARAGLERVADQMWSLRGNGDTDSR